MMSTLEHPLVVDYLTRLEAGAATLTPDRRAELVTDLGEHIEEAVAHTDGSDAAIHEILARLGTPEEVATEATQTGAATESGGAGATPPTPVLEMAALTLLVMGIVAALTISFMFLSPLFTVIGLGVAVFSTRWGRVEKGLAFLAYGVLGPTAVIATTALAFWQRSCIQTGEGTITPDGEQISTVTEVCTGGPPDWWMWVSIPVAIIIVALWIYTGIRLYNRAFTAHIGLETTGAHRRRRSVTIGVLAVLALFAAFVGVPVVLMILGGGSF